MTRGAFTSLLSPCTTSLAMLHVLLFILIYAAIQPGQAHAPKPVIMHPSAASPCLTHIGNPLSYSGYVSDTAMLISHRSVGISDIDDHCTFTKFRPTCFGAVIERAPNDQVICPSLPREVTDSSTNLSLEVPSTRPRSWIPLSQSMNFGRANPIKISDTKSRSDVLSLQATHSSKSISHIASLAPNIAAQYLHRRFHVGARRMNLLPPITADAPSNLSRAKVRSCPHFVAANSTLHSHSSDRYMESRPGRLIHADIPGPFAKSAIDHYKYLLAHVDDRSRLNSVIPSVSHSEAPAKIREFVASFNNFASRADSSFQPIGTRRTDGAEEFTSGKFREELSDFGVHKTESPPEFHSLTDVSDRAIKSIFAHFQLSLKASGVPKSFWPFVVSHTVDILDLTTCPPHNSHTYYESLTDDKPGIKSLWPWGCQASSVKLSSHRPKTNIDRMAWEGIHLGRSTFQSSAFHI